MTTGMPGGAGRARPPARPAAGPATWSGGDHRGQLAGRRAGQLLDQSAARGRRARSARPWSGRSPPRRSAARPPGPAGTAASRWRPAGRAGGRPARPSWPPPPRRRGGRPVRRRTASSPPSQCRQRGGLGHGPAVRPHERRRRAARPRPSTGTKVWRAAEQPTASTAPKASGSAARASAQATTTDVHQPDRVLLGPARLGTGGGQLGPGQGHQAVAVPQGHLGDAGAEVDGEDHRPVHRLGRAPDVPAIVGPPRPVAGPGRRPGRWPSRPRPRP